MCICRFGFYTIFLLATLSDYAVLTRSMFSVPVPGAFDDLRTKAITLITGTAESGGAVLSQVLFVNSQHSLQAHLLLNHFICGLIWLYAGANGGVSTDTVQRPRPRCRSEALLCSRTGSEGSPSVRPPCVCVCDSQSQSDLLESTNKLSLRAYKAGENMWDGAREHLIIPREDHRRLWTHSVLFGHKSFRPRLQLFCKFLQEDRNRETFRWRNPNTHMKARNMLFISFILKGIVHPKIQTWLALMSLLYALLSCGLCL